MHNSGPHVCLVVTNDFVANESLRESRTCGAASASDVVTVVEGGRSEERFFCRHVTDGGGEKSVFREPR